MFICGVCHAEFAPPEAVRRWNFFAREVIISQPYNNLDIQSAEHNDLDGTTKALACCGRCKTEIGRKILHVNAPNFKYMEGLVALDLTLLHLCNGHDIFSLMVHIPMPQPPLLPPHRREPPFFLCIVCNTQVAWRKGLYGIDVVSSRIFLSDSVELVVEPPRCHFVHQNGTTRLAYVKCNGCNEALGMQMVYEEDPSHRYRVGLVGLDMTLLKIWNGTGHEVFSLMKRKPMLMRPPVFRHPDLQQPPLLPPLPPMGT